MNTTEKTKAKKMIHPQVSDCDGTHPSQEELQEWTLLSDTLAAGEYERINRHVESCEICTIYCRLVQAAEKDVEAYLQTETGRKRGQMLLDEIALKRDPTPPVCGLCERDCVTVSDSPANAPAESVVGHNSTYEAGGVARNISRGATATSRRDPAQSCPLTTGGASAPMRLPMYDRRKTSARLEKLAIGKYITSILAQGRYRGQAVGVDGGTTNEAFAEVFGFDAAKNKRDRRVLKTNHRIVPQLVTRYSNRIQVHSVGGLYRPDRETFVGEQAIESVTGMQYAVSVIGINGFDPPWLLTTSGVEDGIKRAFIRSSRDVVFAFDSSKWGFICGSRLAKLSSLFAPEYLMNPDGRTVHLVTTYPVLDPAADGTEYAEVLRHRERFLAGLKRLTTNGWRKYGTEVCGVIVHFPDGETLDPKLELGDAHQLDHLPLDYFENLEQDPVRVDSNAAQSVLVVSIDFVSDFMHTRRLVGKRSPKSTDPSLVEVVTGEDIHRSDDLTADK